jgi:cysteinyl-tRNA synthetase
MDSGEFRAGNAAAALQFLARFDSVFDVLNPTVASGEISDTEIDLRIVERTAAKKARNFALADQIRDQLLQQGIVLEDTKSGVRWKRKSN